MSILDDVCAQIHGQSSGVDAKFLVKVNQQVGAHAHYQPGAESFLIQHYAVGGSLAVGLAMQS